MQLSYEDCYLKLKLYQYCISLGANVVFKFFHVITIDRT